MLYLFFDWWTRGSAGEWAYKDPLFRAAIGALISGTDPIAVIALLRESGVGGRLRLLVRSWLC